MSDTRGETIIIDSSQTSPDDASKVQASIQTAMRAPVPRFYVNGIVMTISATDLFVSLMWNGATACNINMSLSFAKGLAADLIQAVEDYEKLSGEKVQASGALAAVMQRNAAAASSDS